MLPRTVFTDQSSAFSFFLQDVIDPLANDAEEFQLIVNEQLMESYLTTNIFV